MAKTNKDLIIESIAKLNEKNSKRYPDMENFVLGCWDNEIEKISKKELIKVTEAVTGDTTDIDVNIRKKLHVVEISVVDNEIDFQLLTQSEYINRYGDERWDEE